VLLGQCCLHLAKWSIKGLVLPKMKFMSKLLNLMSLQTRKTFVHLRNTNFKEKKSMDEYNGTLNYVMMTFLSENIVLDLNLIVYVCV